MSDIKMLLFDIDGVITDGKRYTDGNDVELKTIALKDLDAFQMLRDAGYKIGCVSGEDTIFSRQFADIRILDYVKIGCKNKESVLLEIEKECHISSSEICYVGDGKYDIPLLKKVKLAICPSDAIDEVKKIVHIILSRAGGEGCIAEVYTRLMAMRRKDGMAEGSSRNIDSTIQDRILEHRNTVNQIMEDAAYIKNIGTAAQMLIESLGNKGQLFLCGNGGSAADAQHLAAELMGRFYLERKALNAEALTTNTSIVTALANDYDYTRIFARQLEAKAIAGDVLIGITTSGTSENVLQAFYKAKEMRLSTILLTGNISKYLPILRYTDCLLAVQSDNVPRIQEMHILTGHIICEIVEQELARQEEAGGK